MARHGLSPLELALWHALVVLEVVLLTADDARVRGLGEVVLAQGWKALGVKP